MKSEGTDDEEMGDTGDDAVLRRAGACRLMFDPGSDDVFPGAWYTGMAFNLAAAAAVADAVLYRIKSDDVRGDSGPPPVVFRGCV